MEYRFSYEPQEVVYPCPELGYRCYGLGPAFKKRYGIDEVPETEYETSDDKCRYERCEYLGEVGKGPLQQAHVRLSFLLYSVLRHSLDS